MPCIHLEESKRKQLAEMLVTTLGADQGGVHYRDL